MHRLTREAAPAQRRVQAAAAAAVTMGEHHVVRLGEHTFYPKLLDGFDRVDRAAEKVEPSGAEALVDLREHQVRRLEHAAKHLLGAVTTRLAPDDDLAWAVREPVGARCELDRAGPALRAVVRGDVTHGLPRHLRRPDCPGAIERPYCAAASVRIRSASAAAAARLKAWPACRAAP